MSATLEKPMSKRSDEPGKDQSVRIAGDVVQMARTISSITGGSMADVISKAARPVLRGIVADLIKSGKHLPPEPKK